MNNDYLGSWFWAQMPTLLKWYLSAANGDGVEPAPNSTLLNDGQNAQLAITPGNTYRLRIINVSNMASNFISFEGHELTVIAVDGVNVEAATTSSLYINTAQRMDVLLTAKPTAQQNHFFVSSLDQSMYGGNFDITNPVAYGYLVYNSKLPLPPVSVPNFNPINDFTLVPLDKQSIWGPVSQTITINMIFVNDNYGINRLFESRFLESRRTDFAQGYYQQSNLCSPNRPEPIHSIVSSCGRCDEQTDLRNWFEPFCRLLWRDVSETTHQNTLILKRELSVEVVVNNFDTGSHPWHMHGHQFQVVYHGNANTIMWDGTQELSQIPVRRDVMLVNTNSSTVWRFKANNPGIFLIHW
jgi:iron transport multicopper oxidase